MLAVFVNSLLGALTHGGVVPALWVIGVAILIAGVVVLVRGALLAGVVLVVLGIVLGGLNVF